MANFAPRNLVPRQAMPTAAGQLTGALVPGSTNFSGVAVQCSNNSGVARYGILWAVPSGGSRTTTTEVVGTFTIPNGESQAIVPIQDVLEQYYALHAWCSGADVSIVGSGLQETP